MSVLERLYFFHEELKLNRFPNARNLVEQFEISPATARRDIAYLRDRLLAPLEFSHDKNGFYYSHDNFGLPFENSPKISFLLGMLTKLAEEAGLGSLAEVKQLEKKLTSMIFLDYHKVVQAIHCEWIEVETVDSAIFETIISSLVSSRLLQISYRAVTGKTTARKIEALKMVNYQGRWYLIAFCTMRKSIRLFHMARISKAEISQTVISEPSQLPNDYFEKSFGIFSGKNVEQVSIRFSSTAAELVQQQHWHVKQEITRENDSVILTLPVADDREIMTKILQYGAMAEVLAPLTLREKIEKEIREMGLIYSS